MIELLTDPTNEEEAIICRLPRVIVPGNPKLEALLNLPVRLDDRIVRLGDAPHRSGWAKRTWRDFLLD